MSISTLESAASVRALDQLDAEEREHAAIAQQLRDAFALAVERGDVTALALFSPRKTYRGGCPDKVTPTVAEVLAESLDANDFMQRAMAVLVNAAAGRATQRTAQALLAAAGARWADREADFA